MRVAAAVLLVVLSAACQDPAVPKYELNPGGPTVQIPTTLKIAAQSGTGSSAHQGFITASLRDQEGRGIPDVMLTFTTSKGIIEPATAKTDINGSVRTTVTNGTDVRVTVSGAGLTNGVDVLLSASLSVGLSIGRAEKNVPTKLEATIAGEATAPVRFAWTFGDGQVAQTEVNSIVHTWAEDGTVHVSVSVTDAIDRVGTTSTSVLVRDNPEPPAPPSPPAPPVPSVDVALSVSPLQPIAGQVATLTAVTTPHNSPPAVTSFDWDCTNDGTIDGTTAGNTFPCTYSAAGAVTAKAIAHAGTVTGTGTLPMTVLADAPLFVSVTASPLVGIIIGTPVTFTATVTSTGPVPALLRWEWDDNGDGTTDFIVSSAASPNLRILMFGTTGPKTVKVRVSHPASNRDALGTAAVTVN